MRMSSEGLFIVQRGVGMLPWPSAYCKIAEAKVITHISTSDVRFIAYSVKAWQNKPADGESPTFVTVGDDSFWVTSVPWGEYTSADIDDICKQHFLLEVAAGRYNDKAHKRLIGTQSGNNVRLGYGFYITDGVNAPTLKVAAKQAWHTEHHTSTGTLPIEKTDSFSTMLLVDNTLSNFNQPFDLSRQWFKAHRAHLIEPDVFSKQRFIKL